MPFPQRPLRERIEKNSIPEPNTGCWLWTSGVSPDGYARLYVGGRDGKWRSAHRVSYEAFRGEIPVGMELDHLCRVRSCVNPHHLEAVTKKTNSRRGLRCVMRGKDRRGIQLARAIGLHVSAEVTRMFGISEATAYRVCLGQTWD